MYGQGASPECWLNDVNCQIATGLENIINEHQKLTEAVRKIIESWYSLVPAYWIEHWL
jgi:hypothetical protein